MEKLIDLLFAGGLVMIIIYVVVAVLAIVFFIKTWRSMK